MHIHNKFSNPYTKFCVLAAAVRALPATPKMSIAQESVLKKLLVLWGLGEKVQVVGFMRSFGDLSPTTVHRVLGGLKKLSMIQLIEDDVDARRRYISSTDLCKRYLALMDKIVVDANNYDQAPSSKLQAQINGFLSRMVSAKNKMNLKA